MGIGVEAAKEKRDFRSKMEGWTVGVAEGVDGGSYELVKEVEGVNPGFESCEVERVVAAAGKGLGDGAGKAPLLLTPLLSVASSKMAILFPPSDFPLPNPSKSGRLSIASSIESSEKMVMSPFFERLDLEAFPTVGLGSTTDPKNRLRLSSVGCPDLGDRSSRSSQSLARLGGRGSDIVDVRMWVLALLTTGGGADMGNRGSVRDRLRYGRAWLASQGPEFLWRVSCWLGEGVKQFTSSSAKGIRFLIYLSIGLDFLMSSEEAET